VKLCRWISIYYLLLTRYACYKNTIFYIYYCIHACGRKGTPVSQDVETPTREEEGKRPSRPRRRSLTCTLRCLSASTKSIPI
jgi:hypothetical protein